MHIKSLHIIINNCYQLLCHIMNFAHVTSVAAKVIALQASAAAAAAADDDDDAG